MRTLRALKPADHLALGIICLLLIVRCLIDGRLPMWTDEIITYKLVHDPSLSHMVTAMGDQADASPPVYYFLARGWAAIFSGHELSLRLFSTCGFCIGFILLWAVMRRQFGFNATLLAFAVILVPNEMVTFQTMNARSYGLLFALITLTLWLVVRIAQTDRPPWRLLAANALTQAVLVLTHPLSGFSSVAILGGVLLADFFSKPRRFRWWIPASFILGWLAILLWWKQFFRQADINVPGTWIPVPDVMDFVSEIRTETNIQLYLWFVLLLAVGWLFEKKRPRSQEPTTVSAMRRTYLFIGGSLIALAPFFWLLSNAWPANSIFLPRYLLTLSLSLSLMGWMILLAALVTFLFRRISFLKQLVMACLGLVLVAFGLKSLATPVSDSLLGNGPVSSTRAYRTGIADEFYGHLDLPIVCTTIHDFLPRRHYSTNAARYYFLLDAEAEFSPTNRFAKSVAFKALSAFVRYGYETNAVPAADFFRAHDAFLVIDVPEKKAAEWCSLFLKNYSYTVTPLTPSQPPTDHKGNRPLYLVEIKR